MDLNQVAVFIKVVESGSFSAAAKLLSLPVSTVSDRVARLEKHLSTILLNRSTRKLSLTREGEDFYNAAEKGIEQLYQAEAALSNNTGQPSGRLRITTPIDIGEPVIGTIIQTLYQRYPDIDIEIVVMSRKADMITEGFDAAIRIGSIEDTSLVAKNIGSALWGAFASEAYLLAHDVPETPAELAGHRCLQFTPRGKDFWVLNNRDREVIVPMTNKLLINNINTLQYLTHNGNGIALLPLYQSEFVSYQGLKRVLPAWTSCIDSINIIYHKKKYIPLQLKAFIEVATEVISEMVKSHA